MSLIMVVSLLAVLMAYKNAYARRAPASLPSLPQVPLRLATDEQKRKIRSIDTCFSDKELNRLSYRLAEKIIRENCL